MSKRVKVNLTIRDDAELSAVVATVRGLGLAVERELAGIGVIIGEADESALDQLAGAQGVASVERTREIKLPPPSSPTQ